MRASKALVAAATLLSSALPITAAAAWGFSDATLSVQAKGAGVGGGLKEKLTENKALPKPVELGTSDTLKIALTTQEGRSSKRPHQTYLSLTDLSSGLETSFPFSVKESGKAKVELTQKDVPTQLLVSSSPLSVELIVASFGSTKPYKNKAFDLSIKTDPDSPQPSPEKPLRYGKLPEIHHIFKADPKSPPVIITMFFAAIALAAFPALGFVWLALGANVNHLSQAMSKAPVSHSLYFGSILAMEGVFFMYYTSWNLFQTLPVAGAVAMVILLSGSRALTEVQERRLAGLR